MPSKMWGGLFFPWRGKACHFCVMKQFGNIHKASSMPQVDFEFLLHRLEANDKSW